MISYRDLTSGLLGNSEFLSEFSQKAAAWGVSMIPDVSKPCFSRTVRCSLVPRPFAKHLYEKAASLNEVFNKLIDAISLDLAWLSDALQGLCLFVKKYENVL